MAIAYSKLTTQGQISIPTEVRRRLGVGPGSVLEWEEDGERMMVRRAGRYTSEDVHQALFEKAPEPRTLEELKEGVRWTPWWVEKPERGGSRPRSRQLARTS